MAPTLIVLGLLALGVAIVAWATRPSWGQNRIARHEQDIVWDDSMGSASTARLNDPFAHAPDPTETYPVERRP